MTLRLLQEHLLIKGVVALVSGLMDILKHKFYMTKLSEEFKQAIIRENQDIIIDWCQTLANITIVSTLSGDVGISRHTFINTRSGKTIPRPPIRFKLIQWLQERNYPIYTKNLEQWLKN
jgi:hypothetical protein